MKSPTPALTRVAWVEGSRLTKRDLADAIAHEARMLELHVATMHGTWGVAGGLRVVLAGDLRSVRVSAGSAYTARGESVVLVTPSTVLAPTGAGTTFDLLLSPPSSAELGPCEQPNTTCTGDVIAVRPNFRWSASAGAFLGGDVKLGAEIPIARVTRAANGTLSALDLTQRRGATSLARPHVASGRASGGQLTWKQTNVDLYAEVDTSAAGFTGSPGYYASIASTPDWSGLIGPFVGIEQQSATSFVARLVFATQPPHWVFLPALVEQAAAVEIAWVGVESASGCPPTFSLGTGSSVAILNPWATP